MNNYNLYTTAENYRNALKRLCLRIIRIFKILRLFFKITLIYYLDKKLKDKIEKLVELSENKLQPDYAMYGAYGCCVAITGDVHVNLQKHFEDVTNHETDLLQIVDFRGSNSLEKKGLREDILMAMLMNTLIHEDLHKSISLVYNSKGSDFESEDHWAIQKMMDKIVFDISGDEIRLLESSRIVLDGKYTTVYEYIENDTKTNQTIH